MRPSLSLTRFLLLLYTALVLYASLYPFSGWRWPPGLGLQDVLLVRWQGSANAFDIWANLLGYAPLGALAAVALLQRGQTRGKSKAIAAFGAWAACSALSYVCESAQNLLPLRVPSTQDFVLNATGAALGIGITLVADGLGWLQRWQEARQRWFSGESAWALALVALWPAVLLMPSPVPLGLGEWGSTVRALAMWALKDVAFADALELAIDQWGIGIHSPSAFMELSLVVAGALAPCLVAFSVLAPGWRRLVVLPFVLGSGVLALTFSAWLNFGASHGWAWARPGVIPALFTACGLAALMMPLQRLMVAGLGLMVITVLVIGVSQLPPDPYVVQNLQSLEQSRFIRFYGLLPWLARLWPLAAIAWLLSRLVYRPAGPERGVR